MKLTNLHVVLPENWFEVPDVKPREFRSIDDETGRLQISLNPPLAPDTDPLNDLRLILAGTSDLGEEQAAELDEFPTGPVATLLFKSPRVGLFQAWLISHPDASIFATYTMGSLARAQYELRESSHILRGMRIVSTMDDFVPYSPPPEEPRPWWKFW
mgnify:CR=1 FL=1|jgi:hypothetical protein